MALSVEDVSDYTLDIAFWITTGESLAPLFLLAAIFPAAGRAPG